MIIDEAPGNSTVLEAKDQEDRFLFNFWEQQNQV